MKKLALFLCIVTVLISSALNPASAADGDYSFLDDMTLDELNSLKEEINRRIPDVAQSDVYKHWNPETDQVSVIVDAAGLLSDDEEKNLVEYLNQLTSYSSAIFLTIDMPHDTSQHEFGKEMLEQVGRTAGLTDGYNALICIIDMDKMQLTIYAGETAGKILTSDVLNSITDNTYTYASQGDYYGCAREVFSQLFQILEGADNPVELHDSPENDIDSDYSQERMESESTSSYDKNICEVDGCYKEGAKSIIGLSGQKEYYCDEHYEEMMDFFDMMESDVADNEYSQHICEVDGCNKEGTNSVIGLSGQTEYYCTRHYEEMVSIINMILGESKN